MQISNRAWHLRMVRAQMLEPYIPSNLCNYFWRVVGILLFDTVGIAIILGILGGIGFGIYKLYILFQTDLIDALLGVGLGLSMFSIIGIIVWLDQRKRKRPKEPKPPGLVRSYIKARKERYCPLIEVVEEEVWRTPKAEA